MSEEVARAVVWSILIAALAVWMSAVRFVARVRNSQRGSEAAERLVFESQVESNQIVGQVTVAAAALGLAEKLARALAQPQVSQLGTIRVTRVEPDRVAFEQVEPDRQAGLRIGQGEVRFVPAGPASCVAHYRLAMEHGRGRLFTAQLLLVAGLAAIGGMWLVMEIYVIPNPSPQVRWQSLQALQVVHVLWPPFQLASLHRAGRAAAMARIEALLSNLPHLP
jgi:hypothetical protein